MVKSPFKFIGIVYIITFGTIFLTDQFVVFENYIITCLIRTTIILTVIVTTVMSLEKRGM